jgi:hypothetical protein
MRRAAGSLLPPSLQTQRAAAPRAARRGSKRTRAANPGTSTALHEPIITWPISLKSCDTSTRPPSQLLMASASESMVSMSRWLVGSSSSIMCGVRCASHANTTRDLRPSDNCLMGNVWLLPVMPKRPTTVRIDSSVISLYSRIMYWRWGKGGGGVSSTTTHKPQPIRRA